MSLDQSDQYLPAVSNIAVTSVGATELHHQSQLVDLANAGEDWHQLILETVSWNPSSVI